MRPRNLHLGYWSNGTSTRLRVNLVEIRLTDSVESVQHLLTRRPWPFYVHSLKKQETLPWPCWNYCTLLCFAGFCGFGLDVSGLQLASSTLPQTLAISSAETNDQHVYLLMSSWRYPFPLTPIGSTWLDCCCDSELSVMRSLCAVWSSQAAAVSKPFWLPVARKQSGVSTCPDTYQTLSQCAGVFLESSSLPIFLKPSSLSKCPASFVRFTSLSQTYHPFNASVALSETLLIVKRFWSLSGGLLLFLNILSC